MRLPKMIAAAGLAIAALGATTSANAQDGRHHRTEYRDHRYGNGYRDGYRHSYRHGRPYGWHSGRYYGWNRHHRRCWTEWRHHHRVRVCR